MLHLNEGLFDPSLYFLSDEKQGNLFQKNAKMTFNAVHATLSSDHLP